MKKHFRKNADYSRTDKYRSENIHTLQNTIKPNEYNIK